MSWTIENLVWRLAGFFLRYIHSANIFDDSTNARVLKIVKPKYVYVLVIFMHTSSNIPMYPSVN